MAEQLYREALLVSEAQEEGEWVALRVNHYQTVALHQTLPIDILIASH